MTFLLLFFYLLKLLLLKLRLQLKKTELDYEGITLTDLRAKAAATGSVDVVAQVDEVHFVSAKEDPLLPDFWFSYLLVTWQESVPESEKLRWTNNGCQFNEVSVVGSLSHLIPTSSLANPTLNCFCRPSPTKVPLLLFTHRHVCPFVMPWTAACPGMLWLPCHLQSPGVCSNSRPSSQ